MSSSYITQVTTSLPNKVSNMVSSATTSSSSRTFSSSMMICSVILAFSILLCLISSADSRSIKEKIVKGKGKYIPDDCAPEHCGGCKDNEVCKEKVIYGDILVCSCYNYKLADIPVIYDLTSNQF